MRYKKLIQKVTRALFLTGILLLSACALIERQIDAPSVIVERIQTETATIRSAYFVEYRNNIYLAGYVAAKWSSRNSLFGHVHAAITAPDGADILCTIARHRNPLRQFRKPFRAKLERIPEPGSLVRVWHHYDEMHQPCHAS